MPFICPNFQDNSENSEMNCQSKYLTFVVLAVGHQRCSIFENGEYLIKKHIKFRSNSIVTTVIEIINLTK